MNAAHRELASGRTMVFTKAFALESPMMRETTMKRLSTNWKLLLMSRNAVGSV